MEERRKIIIPTGADPDATLAKPFFNTEATRAARPVVPLPETEVAPAQPAAAVATAPTAPTKRWMILLPLVIAAIGIGVAAGFAISSYQRRNAAAETSVAVRPVASKSPTTLPWTYTPEEEELIVEDDAIASADETADETAQPPQTVPEDNPARVANDDREKERREARQERAEDKRDKEQEARDDRAAEREQRRQEREQRRGRRNRQNDDDDLPQDPIRRTRDEVHRIREIFEGIP
jgi:hypothetical protein